MKAFPILRPPGEEGPRRYIRWDALNEEQALKNHGQTLKRLAERGGLSMCEALAVIKRSHWRKMTHGKANSQIQEYLCIPDSAGTSHD